MSSASSTLTLDRALGVANQSGSDPGRVSGVSRETVAQCLCRTSLSTLLGHVLMMRFVRLRLEDRRQLRCEAIRRTELSSVCF